MGLSFTKSTSVDLKLIKGIESIIIRRKVEFTVINKPIYERPQGSEKHNFIRNVLLNILTEDKPHEEALYRTENDEH